MLKQLVKYAFLPFALITSSPSDSSAENYSISQVTAPNGAVEYRLKKDDRHFLSVINNHGAFIIRPHPGDDINGWGSSLYMQAFLPGAKQKHSTIDSVVAGVDGVEVNSHGKVSRGANSTFGDWQFNMNFSFNQNEKEIIGEGQYFIQIPQPLTKAKVDSEFVRKNNPRLYKIITENPKLSFGDLNLYKLASNYLHDVPLLDNGIGDTGDMQRADIYFNDVFQLSWFPLDATEFFHFVFIDNLAADVLGQYNNVDTAAQGHERIEPAYKPDMKVTLDSHQSGIPMIFGGIYNLNFSQVFESDNIGITPLILQRQTDLTDFGFDVSFQSDADIEPKYFSLFNLSNSWHNPTTPNDLIEMLEN